MKLSEKLVFLRKEKRLSQLKLAELMNVSRQAVSRWEVGAATPSIENLKYLSGLYGVSLEYLLDEDEDSPAGTDGRVPEKKLSKGTVLTLTIAAVCIFALGAGAALGFVGPGNRESGGDMSGEIGSRVYDGYTIAVGGTDAPVYDGYTEIEADEEIIGGHVFGYGVVNYDGGLAGSPVYHSNP